MAVRVPINGETLRWARELANVDLGTLARFTGVTPERIAAFESDPETQPTYLQASKLAQKLDRTLSFLLVPPPNQPDIPVTVDFRGRGTDSEALDLLRREVKRAEEHRQTMSTLGVPRARPALASISRSNAGERAQQLRDNLGLTQAFVPPNSQRSQVFRFWRDLLEANGFLVFQTTRISLATFKGLAVDHESLPIILVNGADYDNSKIFTLFHEVAHLVNRTSGLCVLNDDVTAEVIANAFAANFLMPESATRNRLRDVEQDDWLDTLTWHFKVSSLAAAYRLRTLDLIDETRLREIEREAGDAWRADRERRKDDDSFVPPWRLRYRDLGSRYVGTVARALEDERIDLVDATYLLNARLPMVEQMFSEYYRTSGVAE